MWGVGGEEESSERRDFSLALATQRVRCFKRSTPHTPLWRGISCVLMCSREAKENGSGELFSQNTAKKSVKKKLKRAFERGEGTPERCGLRN